MGWYDTAVQRVNNTQGQILRLNGQFRFNDKNVDYTEGFSGLIFRYGAHIEGVVTDLYQHPQGVSNQRYIIGKITRSEISFVKLPPQPDLEVYCYKALANGTKNIYDGIIGSGRFEFLTGEWCTSLFAETIRFDFGYGENACQVNLEEVIAEDLFNELVSTRDSDALREVLKKKCIDFLNIYNNKNETVKQGFEKYCKFLDGCEPEELWELSKSKS